MADLYLLNQGFSLLGFAGVNLSISSILSFKEKVIIWFFIHLPLCKIIKCPHNHGQMSCSSTAGNFFLHFCMEEEERIGFKGWSNHP